MEYWEDRRVKTYAMNAEAQEAVADLMIEGDFYEKMTVTIDGSRNVTITYRGLSEQWFLDFLEAFKNKPFRVEPAQEAVPFASYTESEKAPGSQTRP